MIKIIKHIKKWPLKNKKLLLEGTYEKPERNGKVWLVKLDELQCPEAKKEKEKDAKENNLNHN